MEIFDNITKTVKHDMETSINKGSRLDIAAACFSIYAYQELKKQLEGIDELCFIFTSQIFTADLQTDQSESAVTAGVRGQGAVGCVAKQAAEVSLGGAGQAELAVHRPGP